MKRIFNRIKNTNRKSKVIAVVLTTAVLAASVYFGFVKQPEVSASEVANPDKAYLDYVVDRMIGGLQKEFTILEIVPYEGQGEFRYYIGEDEVEEGLESNLTLMEAYYSTKGCYKYNGKWNVTDKWYDMGSAFSNFGYQFMYNSETGKFEVESPKRFLNYVVPEYKELFEDRIKLRTVEGNDLTEEDILAADFIIISTGTHDQSTIACYNSYTNSQIKNVNDAYTLDANIYKGTINSDGTGDMTQVTSMGEITYNTYEKNDDGTYRSRDISWEMVELLWEYTIRGKDIQLSDGSHITTAVPVILDNQQFSNLNKDGNMYKYQLLFRMLTLEQYEKIFPYISNVDKNGKLYINSENINTGLYSVDKNFAADANLSLNRDDIYKVCGDYNSGLYKDNNPPHASYLTNDYWVYSGDSCLIPANKDNNYFTGGSYDDTGFYDRVGSPATVIDVMRYLLGAKDDPIIKHKKVKILEIEPCASFDYDSYSEVKALANRLLLDVDGELKDAEGNNIFDPLTESNYKTPGANVCLQVDCMSTAAFNGINKDIVAEYDVIYIGSNDEILLKNDSGSTIYNDKNLNGYIYLAFGDMIKAKTGISTYYPEDYQLYTPSISTNGSYTPVNNNLWNVRESETNYMTYTKVYKMGTQLWSKYLSDRLTAGKYYILKNVADLYSGVTSNDKLFATNTGTLRLSGNDITQLKCDELKEFVDSGKLVVMSEEVYNNDDEKLYPTSNVAELSQYIIDKDTKASRLLSKKIGAMLLYISNSNPVLDFSSGTIPTPVEHDANENVCTFNSTGTVLPFKFTIKGKPSTRYHITIYVDKNNDGVFYESDDITTDMNEQFYNSDVVLDAEGKLNVNIKAELSENFSGLISYKLVVTELDATGKYLPYRAGISGYTAIKGDVKKNIKVLQIIPNISSKSKVLTLNMETDEVFNKLLNQASSVINYNIDVRTVTTNEYEDWFKGTGKAYNPDDYNTNHLAPYDMVVIGFADLYGGDDISNDNGALECIDDFIDAGKAVLFTHDTVGYSNTVNGVTISSGKLTKHSTNVWGTSLSRMFRVKVGMDRYGITDDELRNVPYYKDGTALTYGLQGINNMLAYRHSLDTVPYSTKELSSGTYKLYPYERNTSTESYNNYSSLQTTTKVSKLNDGQVTMYPYRIDDELKVATTHAQWYQLDMEDDSIVVWYTLAGDGGVSNSQYYADSDKDAANNFYIYSKGNITYSGAGHSEMNSEDELKLFVNTVIKAITAGNNIPEVKVVNSSYSSGQYNVYVTPYSGNYEFTFYGEDLDLLPYVGKFKTAKVTWLNPESVDGNKDVTWDMGNTLTSCTRITISIGGGSQFDAYADQISKLIDDGFGANFYIEVTDMYGDVGSAQVRLLKRELFELD